MSINDLLFVLWIAWLVILTYAIYWIATTVE